MGVQCDMVRIVEPTIRASEWNVLERPASLPERPEGLLDAVGRTPAVEGQHAAGRLGSGSVTVVGARAVERVNVPGSGAVTVPVGEKARPRRRPVMAGGVVPVAGGQMPIPVPVIPLAVAVDAAGVTVIPVGSRLNSVGVEVQSVGVPLMSVRVPRVVRPGSRRAVGMGNR